MLEMEDNPPGDGVNSNDTIVNSFGMPLLTSNDSFREWKRRCSFYLSYLLNRGIDPLLSIETLVEAYFQLESRSNIQDQLGLILERLLRLHKYDGELKCQYNF